MDRYIVDLYFPDHGLAVKIYKNADLKSVVNDEHDRKFIQINFADDIFLKVL